MSYDFSQAGARCILYGGTFDPIHRGHLYAAKQAISFYREGPVVFMPSGTPPHKTGRVGASARERLELLRLALENEQDLEISEWEIFRENRCYTSDTLRELTRIAPDTEFVFLMGADSFLQLELWHEPETIMRLARLAVVWRPGSLDSQLVRVREEYLKTPGVRIDLIPCEGMDISSTAIRKAAAEGKDMSQWVLPGEEAYIREHHLYGRDEA